MKMTDSGAGLIGLAVLARSNRRVVAGVCGKTACRDAMRHRKARPDSRMMRIGRRDRHDSRQQHEYGDYSAVEHAEVFKK